LQRRLRQPAGARYRKGVTAALSVLLWLTAGETSGAPVKAPALRAELLSMRDADQAARAAITGTPPSPETARRLEQTDRGHTVRLKAIVARWGWPGKSLVGEDGASAAWLLVQHAGHDRPFQKACLRRMRRALARQEVSAVDVAYLADRVAIAEGGKQLYGTQFTVKPTATGVEVTPDPIEDPARLDERRRRLGLPPFAEYEAQIRALAGRPAPKPAE
jgi:hypothetical protein